MTLDLGIARFSSRLDLSGAYADLQKFKNDVKGPKGSVEIRAEIRPDDLKQMKESLEKSLTISSRVTDRAKRGIVRGLTPSRRETSGITDSIVSAIEVTTRPIRAVGRTIGRTLVNAITAPFSRIGRLIADSIEKIGQGVFFGIGFSIGRQIQRGIQGALTGAFDFLFRDLNRFAARAGQTIAGELQQSVNVAAEIDEALRVAVALQTGTDPEVLPNQLQALRDEISRVAADPTLKITTGELSQAVLTLAKAGNDLVQIQSQLEPIARATTINVGREGGDAGSTTQDFIKSTARFNLDLAESVEVANETLSGQDQALATIEAALTQARLELDEFANSIRYFGRTRNDLNGLIQAAQLITLTARAGFTGSTAGIGLNEIFSPKRLGNIIEALNEYTAAAGVTLDQQLILNDRGEVEDQVRALQELTRVYREISATSDDVLGFQQDITVALGERGSRVFNAIATLTEEDFREVIAQVTPEAGQETINTLFDSLSERIGQGAVSIENNLEEFRNQLGQLFGGNNGIVDILGRNVGETLEILSNLLAGRQAAGINERGELEFVQFAGIDEFNTQLMGVGESLRLLRPDFVEIVTTLGTDFIGFVTQQLGEFNAFISNPTNRREFIRDVRTIVDVVSQAGAFFFNFIESELRAVYQLIQELTRLRGDQESIPLRDYFQGIFGNIERTLIPILQGFSRNVFRQILPEEDVERLNRALASFGQFVSATVRTIVGVGRYVLGVVNSVSSFFLDTQRQIPVIGVSVGQIIQGVGSAYEFVSRTIQDGIDRLLRAYPGLADGIQTVFGGAIEFFRDVGGTARELLPQLAVVFEPTFDALGDFFLDAGKLETLRRILSEAADVAVLLGVGLNRVFETVVRVADYVFLIGGPIIELALASIQSGLAAIGAVLGPIFTLINQALGDVNDDFRAQRDAANEVVDAYRFQTDATAGFLIGLSSEASAAIIHQFAIARGEASTPPNLTNWGIVIDAFNSHVAAFTASFVRLRAEFRFVVATLVSQFNAIVTRVTTAFAAVRANLGILLVNIRIAISVADQMLTNLWERIRLGFVTTVGFIRARLRDGLNIYSLWFSNFFEGIRLNVRLTIREITTRIRLFIRFLTELIIDFFEMILDWILDLSENIVEFFENLIDRTVDTIRQLLRNIRDFFDAILQWFLNVLNQGIALWNRFISGIRNVGVQVIEIFINWGRAIQGAIAQAFPLLQRLQDFIDFVSNGIQRLFTIGGGVGDAASAALEGASGGIADLFGNIVGGVLGGLANAGSLTIDVVGRLTELLTRNSPWRPITERNPVGIDVAGRLVLDTEMETVLVPARLDVDSTPLEGITQPMTAQAVDLSGMEPVTVSIDSSEFEDAGVNVGTTIGTSVTTAISDAIMNTDVGTLVVSTVNAEVDTSGFIPVSGTSRRRELESVVPADFLTGEQYENAVAIVQEGLRLRNQGVTSRDIVVALAAAQQESSLRNINYGDDWYFEITDGGVSDSRGLFQQREFWGTLAERMDPETAARLFFLGGADPGTQGLVAQTNRGTRDIGELAQAVQRSAFPEHYNDDVEAAYALFELITTYENNLSGVAAAIGEAAESARTLKVPESLRDIFTTGAQPAMVTNQTITLQARSLPTGTLGTGAQEYGASRSGGARRHAGQDFDIGPTDAFYAFLGGEVTRVGYDPGGYYNYIDVFNRERGVVIRYAEIDNLRVSEGQRIEPGQLLGQGTQATGVVHVEVRTDVDEAGRGGFGFTGTVDPIQYLEDLGVGQRVGTSFNVRGGTFEVATGPGFNFEQAPRLDQAKLDELLAGYDVSLNQLLADLTALSPTQETPQLSLNAAASSVDFAGGELLSVSSDGSEISLVTPSGTTTAPISTAEQGLSTAIQNASNYIETRFAADIEAAGGEFSKEYADALARDVTEMFGIEIESIEEDRSFSLASSALNNLAESTTTQVQLYDELASKLDPDKLAQIQEAGLIGAVQLGQRVDAGPITGSQPIQARFDTFNALQNLDQFSAFASNTFRNARPTQRTLRFMLEGVEADHWYRGAQLEQFEHLLNSPEFMDFVIDAVAERMQHDPVIRDRVLGHSHG